MVAWWTWIQIQNLLGHTSQASRLDRLQSDAVHAHLHTHVHLLRWHAHTRQSVHAHLNISIFIFSQCVSTLSFWRKCFLTTGGTYYKNKSCTTGRKIKTQETKRTGYIAVLLYVESSSLHDARCINIMNSCLNFAFTVGRTWLKSDHFLYPNAPTKRIMICIKRDRKTCFKIFQEKKLEGIVTALKFELCIKYPHDLAACVCAWHLPPDFLWDQRNEWSSTTNLMTYLRCHRMNNGVPPGSTWSGRVVSAWAVFFTDARHNLEK